MTSPHTITAAPTVRDAFLEAVRTAELFSPAHLARAEAAIPRTVKTPAEAARGLVAAGLITRFQAERLLAGRSDGFLLGPYIIQDHIGNGAMGRVYRARHRTMNRLVAIKVIASALTRTAAERQALQREVRTAARLNHPNIATAYDANELAERFYLILEFVDGPNLRALIQERGPLPLAEGCDIIYQAALGLAHAHAHGLIHQNLKPSNLLVTQPSRTQPPQVKITDFGISKLSPRQSEHLESSLESVDFLAPELVHNRHRADHRADLYSLGAVLYYLLTGLPPFPGGTAEEKLCRHLREDPIRVDRLRPDVHPTIAELIHQLLAKNPQARPGSAMDLISQFDEFYGTVSNGVSFELPGGTKGHSAYHSFQLLGHADDPGRHDDPVRRKRNASSRQTAATEFDTSPWEEITGRHRPASLASAATGSVARRSKLSWRASGFLAGMLIVGITAIGFMLKVLGK